MRPRPKPSRAPTEPCSDRHESAHCNEASPSAMEHQTATADRTQALKGETEPVRSACARLGARQSAPEWREQANVRRPSSKFFHWIFLATTSLAGQALWQDSPPGRFRGREWRGMALFCVNIVSNAFRAGGAAAGRAMGRGWYGVVVEAAWGTPSPPNEGRKSGHFRINRRGY